MKHLLREIPPVHAFQQSKRYRSVVEETEIDDARLTKVLQEEIVILREQLESGEMPIEEASRQEIVEYIWLHVEKKISILQRTRLNPVINGTGTVLHTNLGRARLSNQAIEHIMDVARNYSNLEYDLAKGKRGSRHDVIEDLLVKVTGAEAAMVVNNNAAAVYLVLRGLAKDKEVIVSRGQLIEIGGSFRVSSIMEESGAKLVEVGTTNKTHLYDYQQAITEDTKIIMKVHTSNFKTIGFTKSVSSKDLAKAKNQYDHVLLYEDLGSGSLYDFKLTGIGEEPVVSEVIQAGVDLVSFSGDKLLGGPQAGIIVGKKSLIDKLKRHQLARVLRVDKMTLAGLEKTLSAYLSGEDAVRRLPTVRDIIKPIDEILRQANQFLSALYPFSELFQIDLLEETSQIGGGTMPDVELPTYVIAISHQQFSAQQLADRLRNSAPAVVVRIKDNRIYLDFRTITTGEMEELIILLKAILTSSIS